MNDQTEPGIDLRKLLSSGLSVGTVVRAISLIAGFALTVIITRVLQPSHAGAFFLCLSMVVVLSKLASLGVPNAVLAESGRLAVAGPVEMNGQFLRKLALLSLLSSVIVGGTCAVLLPGISQSILRSKLLGSASIVVGFWIVARTMQSVTCETSRGKGEVFWYLFVSGLCSSLVTMGLLLGIGGLGWHADYRGAVTAGLIGAVVASGVGYIRSKPLLGAARGPSRRKPNQPTRTCDPYLRTIVLPLLVADVLGLILTQGDIWIVGGYFGQRTAAVYGAAARVAVLAGLSLTIVNQVVPNLIVRMQEEGSRQRLERTLRGVAGMALVPALAVSFGFILWGRFILRNAFGASYGDGSEILVVLGLAQVLTVASGSAGYVLIMHNRFGSLAMACGVGVVLGFGAAVALAPHVGMIGAALGVAVGIAAQQATMVVAAKRLCGLRTQASVESARWICQLILARPQS
jgi:O-antigen/teichoic acid export membrane protein